MKACAVVTHGRVETVELSRPALDPWEALVKIEGCGLCGTTDRHIVDGIQAHHHRDDYPAILGHESAGRIVAVGDAVRKFRIGDRVTRPVGIWPGTKRDGFHSAWGGFAEYGIVRDAGLGSHFSPDDYNIARQHVVPSYLDLESSILAISISEVASWIQKLGPVDGKTLVIGGTGFAACVMCQCLVAAGAKQVFVFGRSPGKFELLRRNGASEVLTLEEDLPQILRQKNNGLGADWFLDAAGHQTVFSAGLSCLRKGGRAAIYGAPAGFGYQLNLGSVGGDFSVHYMTPSDDVYFLETCRRIGENELRADLLLTHRWNGVESVEMAIDQQAKGVVLKGLVRI